MTNFKTFWNMMNTDPDNYFQKSKLTKAELVDIQNTIATLQKKGLSSSKIIKHLQAMNKKLSEEWKAARAYWTEVKRDDTKIVGDTGEELEIDDYKVILSPHACKICLAKTDNGRKVFKSSDLKKSGYGHVPPFHPNCYCIIIPK